MGPGGLRGLQLRWPRPFGRGGGFDSLALPPTETLPLEVIGGLVHGMGVA